MNVVHDLGQYGMSHRRLERMMQCFRLPEYPMDCEKQDLCIRVRKFLDSFNEHVNRRFKPSWCMVVDESMAQWKGVGMPGLMYVARKPTPLGREMHTTACSETRIISFLERYEGKDVMAQAPLVKDYSKSSAVALRCTKPYWHSGRVVVIDSAFSSVFTAKAMMEHGLHTVGNVKTAHKEYPLATLKKQVTEREVTKAYTTTVISTSRTGSPFNCWPVEIATSSQCFCWEPARLQRQTRREREW